MLSARFPGGLQATGRSLREVDMKLQQVEVECYSGSRADEQPRRIKIDGRQHLVMRLLSQSTEQAVESRDWIWRYTVMTEEFLIIELIRTNGGIWYLVSLSD